MRTVCHRLSTESDNIATLQSTTNTRRSGYLLTGSVYFCSELSSMAVECLIFYEKIIISIAALICIFT